MADMHYERIMAVDPSLTCSGWAVFAVNGEELLAVGKIRSKDASLPLAERLRDLQMRIEGVFDELKFSGRDVVICEAPTTMRDPHAAIKVEQVRGLFESAARTRGVFVPGRINPRSVQYEVMGLRGKQLARTIVKDTALKVADAVHGAALRTLGVVREAAELKRHQDIVDALLLGTLGLAWMRAAAQGGISLDLFFAERAASRRPKSLRTVMRE